MRSEPGRGTTFSIYLPRTTEPPVKEAGVAERRKERCDSETLLIVEDQDEVRHFVVGVLKSLGYKVMEFGTGSEALLAVEQHVGPIHLLLTDVVMPGMNGKELAGRVKLLRPEIRVVYMSGYAADVISQRGLLDPGVQYIAKPFSRDALAARIRETLDQP